MKWLSVPQQEGLGEALSLEVGRRKDVKPFDKLVKEMGLKAAKEFRLKEFRGKSFCIIPQRRPLILDAIAQVGLTEKDVKFLNFAGDQKAATAF